jgi:hypothetical protein
MQLIRLRHISRYLSSRVAQSGSSGIAGGSLGAAAMPRVDRFEMFLLVALFALTILNYSMDDPGAPHVDADSSVSDDDDGVDAYSDDSWRYGDGPGFSSGSDESEEQEQEQSENQQRELQHDRGEGA